MRTIILQLVLISTIAAVAALTPLETAPGSGTRCVSAAGSVGIGPRETKKQYCNPLVTPTPAIEPHPRPINPGQGQPLVLNPVTLCDGSQQYRIKVLGTTARVVTRTETPWGCSVYWEWHDGASQEGLSRCPQDANLPNGTTDELWLWFLDGSPITLEVDCDCDDNTPPEHIVVEPPVGEWP